ncbi:MAG: hypothetical protein ACR2IJ_06030, partial [Fluviibacter sp.]
MQQFQIVQRPSADGSSVNTEYVYGPTGSITRSYADPLGVVGDMISPWPKKRPDAKQRNNAIVGGLTPDELQTLSSNLDEKAFEQKVDTNAQQAQATQEKQDLKRGQQAFKDQLAAVNAERKRILTEQRKAEAEARKRGRKQKPGPEMDMPTAPQNVPYNEIEVTDAPPPSVQEDVFEDATDGDGITAAPPTGNETADMEQVDFSSYDLSGLQAHAPDDDASMGESPTGSMSGSARASTAPAIAGAVGSSSEAFQDLVPAVQSARTAAMEGVTSRIRYREGQDVAKARKTAEDEDVRGGIKTRGATQQPQKSKKGKGKGKLTARSLEEPTQEEAAPGTWRKPAGGAPFSTWGQGGL